MDSKSKDIEYEIEVDDHNEDKVILKHAESESVSSTCRGVTILTATNTGNGLKLKWAEKPGKELDYAQVHHLTIMLNFINKTHTSPESVSIIPDAFVKKLF